MSICHYCEENETDMVCEQCDRPVCESCIVEFTMNNQIDFNLCQDCDDSNNTERYNEDKWEEEFNLKRKKKKEKLAEARRIAYRKPEAVEKRRLKKIEKKRLRREQEHASLVSISEIFKNMNN